MQGISVSDEPSRLERTNTISARFDRQADVDAALQELRRIGISDCYLSTEDGRPLLQVNAGGHEAIVREIIGRHGGHERDLPG